MDLDKSIDRGKLTTLLNRILEEELAGVVRYTHYSFMVYGYNRIPIVDWLRKEATTALAHAHRAGEFITHYGEHPSLSIGPLLETHKHEIGAILKESLEQEKNALALYVQLHDLVVGKDIMLEDYAREMIAEEQMHAGEVDKMLRNPGAIKTFSSEQK
jgi:bacterioferritin